MSDKCEIKSSICTYTFVFRLAAEPTTLFTELASDDSSSSREDQQCYSRYASCWWRCWSPSWNMFVYS